MQSATKVIARTRSHEDAAHQFAGMLIVSLFPALFWTLLAAGIGSSVGHTPSMVALMTFGAAVAVFCAAVVPSCPAMKPKKALSAPVVSDRPERWPEAMLLLPVVSNVRVEVPKPQFPVPEVSEAPELTPTKLLSVVRVMSAMILSRCCALLEIKCRPVEHI